MQVNSLSDILSITKNRLSYSLSDIYRSMFEDLCNLFNCYDYSVFLFGSFSKGMMKSSSDIDLLLLVPNVELDARMKRLIKNELDDDLLNLMIKYGKEIDMKVYGEVDYINSCKRNYFESSIIGDLILLDNCLRS